VDTAIDHPVAGATGCTRASPATIAAALAKTRASIGFIPSISQSVGIRVMAQSAKAARGSKASVVISSLGRSGGSARSTCTAISAPVPPPMASAARHPSARVTATSAAVCAITSIRASFSGPDRTAPLAPSEISTILGVSPCAASAPANASSSARLVSTVPISRTRAIA
jgi:hypothetical protein